VDEYETKVGDCGVGGREGKWGVRGDVDVSEFVEEEVEGAVGGVAPEAGVWGWVREGVISRW